MLYADQEAQYTCIILRGEDLDGGSGPRCARARFSSLRRGVADGGVGRFRITPSDNVDNPITSGTATGAWSVIVKAANKVRCR